MRVLLVEDADDLRWLFTRALSRAGFDVREAANGCEALVVLAAFRPCVIVTDLMMPVLDGLELIRSVRAMPEFGAMPVLAMTASMADEAEHDARTAGATYFFRKPVDLRSLISYLRRLPCRT